MTDRSASASAPGSRDRVLARVRAALGDVPSDEHPDDVLVTRGYRDSHVADDPAALLELLHRNLVDYRAHVHHTTPAELPATLAALLAESSSVVLPAGIPESWLAGSEGLTVIRDGPALTAARLDEIDSVVTGCSLAIAETGTIVLDTEPDQGRRILTLIPDHHICVVRAPDQIVASLPQAMSRLTPDRPLTWISGPSATSDIELDRVEGVHGPRVLDVVLVHDRRPAGTPGPKGERPTRLTNQVPLIN